MQIKFSKQAEKLIQHLNLDKKDVIEWFKEYHLVISGGHIQHYNVDRAEGNYQPKKQS